LHEAAVACPDLGFFHVHSSIAPVIGGATQAHYAAAFAFLDGLVAWRSRQGLPATSLAWGAWSRVGVSARLDGKLAAELVRSGLRFFSPARALRTLDACLTRPPAQYVVGQWDWPALVGSSPLDDAVYARVAADPGRGEAGLDLGELLARPKAERLGELLRVVLAGVAHALHAADDDIDPDTRFVALGLDSLMALDVRTGLETAFKLPLPASLTFDHPSPRELAEFLDTQLVPATRP
jgi:acyl carrier protein